MGNNGNKTNKGGSEDIAALLRAAEAEGKLSRHAATVLNLVDPGAQIQAALGISVDDVGTSEVVLVTLMPDDSSSIRSSGNIQAVQDGHNAILDALGKSKQRDAVLCHTRYLNGHVLYPYTLLENARRMDGTNYSPDSGTPLYDQTVVLLGTVIAKNQEFLEAGVAVRSVTLIITDGADEHSTRASAADVAALVGDLSRAGHIVAAMGIGDGHFDFRAVFRSMGIEDRWILTAANSPSDIRRAFQIFSQSAVALSQSAPIARSAGGFGN